MSGQPRVGEVLADRYALDAPLGEGGMGVVYRARDVRTGAACAIKVLPPALAQDAVAVRRFRREAEALATVSHRGVVRPLDWGQTADGSPFLVMELLEGETLAARLSRAHALPWSIARPLFLEIADALAAAHRAGVLHRDLKPSNVFLTRDQAGNESVRILDFGLAKSIADSDASRLTATGAMLGTPAYMSPEQALGQPVGPTTDVYALGSVLFELVSGLPPFHAATPTAILARLMSEPAPRLATLTPGRAPIGLDDVLCRSLEKRPEARYQRVEDLAAAVAALGDAPHSMPVTHEQRAITATGGISNELTTGPTVEFAASPLPVMTPASAGPAPTPSPFVMGQAPVAVATASPQVPSQSPLVAQPVARPRRSRALWLAPVVLLIAALAAGGGWYAWSTYSNAPATVTTTAQTAQQPPVVQPPVPATQVPAIPTVPTVEAPVEPPVPPVVPTMPAPLAASPYGAAIAFGAGNYQACIAAIRSAPPSETGTQILFVCALQAGQFDEATRACDELRTHYPHNGTGQQCASAIQAMRRFAAMGAPGVPGFPGATTATPPSGTGRRPQRPR